MMHCSDHDLVKDMEVVEFEKAGDTESSDDSSWIDEAEIVGLDPKQQKREIRYYVNLALGIFVIGSVVMSLILLIAPGSTSEKIDLFELRINAGSSETYTDERHRKWLPDTNAEKYQVVGDSNTYDACSPEPVHISDTGRPGEGLYCNERYFSEEGGYQIEVPEDGWYNVTLHFAETFFSSPGERVFDVLVEEELTEGYDIVKEAKASFAANRISARVFVEDGFLSISFIPQTDNAKINGIEVVSDMSPEDEESSAINEDVND